MDCLKIGAIIKSLRKEKSMTQVELANKLNISDKTISKWERGFGCPDITLIVELSEILEVDIIHMLRGDLKSNEIVGGNMKNSTFYVCPSCASLSISTGQAQISCCGRIIEDQIPKKAEVKDKLKVEVDDGEYYITSDHPSTKSNYIAFVAYVLGGGMQLVKVYPEWEMNIRLPRQGRGKLVWYSTQEGLFYQNI